MGAPEAMQYNPTMLWRFFMAFCLTAATVVAGVSSSVKGHQSAPFMFLEGTKPAVVSSAQVESEIYHYSIYYLHADYEELKALAGRELWDREGTKVGDFDGEVLWHCPDYCVSITEGRQWIEISKNDGGVMYCTGHQAGLVTVIVSPFAPGEGPAPRSQQPAPPPNDPSLNLNCNG